MLQPIKSVTHAHLVYVIAAETRPAQEDHPSPLRILDAGCGDGELLLAIHRHLPPLIDRPVELYGFDVSNARIQKSDFFAAALAKLSDAVPDIAWKDRFVQIRTSDPWPFRADHFDYVVSNQVLEHVADINAYMANLARVLRPGGQSINLFPTRSLFLEGHVGAPLAHRVQSNDTREWLLTMFARARLSRRGPMRMAPGQNPEDYGRTRSEYVATQTFYRSFRELAEAAHRHGLVPSYRWTPQFYTTKLGYVLGRDTSRLYRRSSWTPGIDAVAFPLLSRASSVTICFGRTQSYDPDAEDAVYPG